jgi:hypothetical protein
MCINIVNVTKNPKTNGINDYELRINSQVLGTFQHKREEGLVKCLERATQCAKQYEQREIESIDLMLAMFEPLFKLSEK